MRSYRPFIPATTPLQHFMVRSLKGAKCERTGKSEGILEIVMDKFRKHLEPFVIFKKTDFKTLLPSRNLDVCLLTFQQAWTTRKQNTNICLSLTNTLGAETIAILVSTVAPSRRRSAKKVAVSSSY